MLNNILREHIYDVYNYNDGNAAVQIFDFKNVENKNYNLFLYCFIFNFVFLQKVLIVY